MSDKSNVKLNIRSPALKGMEVTDSRESLRDAVTKKMLHKETFGEAWERILSMKNSNPDERWLKEVKEAMENRLIRIEDERRKLSKDIKVTK